MELRTARLVLRDFRTDDVAVVFEYQAKPEYLRHYDGTLPTRDAVDRLIALFREWAGAIPRTKYQLAITLNDRVIGTCGVRQEPDRPAIAEFGCELDPDFWGRGYAAEASRALLVLAVQTLRLERVIARTRPENRAAIRLAEGLGFRMGDDGVLELRGKP